MRPRTPPGPHGLSCAAGRLARALKVGMTRLRPPTVIAMVAGIVARAIGNAVTPLPARRCADVLGAVCGRRTGEGGALWLAFGLWSRGLRTELPHPASQLTWQTGSLRLKRDTYDTRYSSKVFAGRTLRQCANVWRAIGRRGAK